MADEKPKEPTIHERLAEWDKEDLRSILAEKWGRRFIWGLLNKCNVYALSFVPGEQDSTAFNEGRRSIGNALLSRLMDVKPEAYIKMMNEAKKEEKYVRQCSGPDPTPDTGE